MNASIRTVFFDFDGTLVFYRPDSLDVIRAFCAEIGQPLSAEAERLGRRMRHEYFASAETGRLVRQLSTEEFWHHFNRHLLVALDIDGDPDELATRLGVRFEGLEPEYYCPEPVPQVLGELRDRGYQLGLVTNRDGVERFRNLLAHMELDGFFDVALASGEVGIRKPDPGIFFAALERAGACPLESVYVGDNYWADVVGAKQAGMTPILLDPMGLFPEADCPILEGLDDLLVLLP